MKDIQQGLKGVRSAIDTLREYYAADDSAGSSLLQADDEAREVSESDQPAPPQMYQKTTSAGNSIIGLLEVCMSDLAKGLAKEEAEESAKDSEYQKIMKESKVLAAVKERAISYKTRSRQRIRSTRRL